MRLFLYLCFLLTSQAFALAGCASNRDPVPVGDIPPAETISTEEEQYGQQALTELNRRWELDYNDTRFDKVLNIVDQLAEAAGANQDPWHVYLLKAPEVKNAAATRGNHIFVWSGMLDKLQTDGELATILAHEMAHVLSNHTDPDPTEEMTQLLINVGALAAGVAVATQVGTPNVNVGGGLGDLTSALTRGIATEIFTNPYSRELELEADHVGLMIMAKAGYNPQEALNFWRNAQSDPDFAGSSFFSTHPPADTRLQNLEEALPYAEAYYQGKDPSSVAQINPSHSEIPKEILEKYYPPSGDTFDVRSGGEKATALTRWRVRALKALLYPERNTQSKPLGEFRHGATVTAVKDFGTWIEVRSPDAGFLFKEDLEKIP